MTAGPQGAVEAVGDFHAAGMTPGPSAKQVQAATMHGGLLRHSGAMSARAAAAGAASVVKAPSPPAAPEALPIGRSPLPGPISGPVGAFRPLPAPTDQASGAFLPVAGDQSPGPALAGFGRPNEACGKGGADRKAFATVQARAALAGYSLTRSDPADGPVSYLICRWNLSRALRDLDAVEAFLVRAGAPRAGA